MAKSKCVLFLDSGTGGLSTLFQAKKLIKNQNFVYVADFLNSPYGNKTKKELKRIVLNNLKFYIKKFNPSCVVLACNTATAVCLEDARKQFCIPIIGTEPAVLPALKQNFKNILVLCTESTKKHSKLLRQNLNLKIFCPKKLAGLVDQNFCDLSKTFCYISKVLKQFKGRIDAVVLGCTHYVFVKDFIKKVLGDVCVFDGNLGVAKQLSKIVQKSEDCGQVKFVSTNPEKQKMLEDYGKFLKL